MFDILTIGTATRDVFLTSRAFKVLKDKEHLEKLGFTTGEAECFAFGSKIDIEPPVLSVGGGAANAAITAARQGLRAAAIYKIGADELGASVTGALKKEGIAPLPVSDKKAMTAYSTILLNQNGERTVLVHRGASDNLRVADVPLAKAKARWVYIAPGNIAISVMEEIMKRLKRGGAKIAMNPSKAYIAHGGKKLKPLLGLLDVVIMNQEEASELSGEEYKKEKRIFKKLDDLVPGIAVMTKGSAGASVSDGRYLYRAGIFKEKKMIDRTGAGDAFGSGFVVGIVRTGEIAHALRLASANATAVVEHVGAEAGILSASQFRDKRWKYLDMDVEPI